MNRCALSMWLRRSTDKPCLLVRQASASESRLQAHRRLLAIKKCEKANHHRPKPSELEHRANWIWREFTWAFIFVCATAWRVWPADLRRRSSARTTLAVPVVPGSRSPIHRRHRTHFHRRSLPRYHSLVPLTASRSPLTGQAAESSVSDRWTNERTTKQNGISVWPYYLV